MENLDSSELLHLFKFPQLIFGPTINSESDEYRRVVSDQPEFGNRLMIFSSNRPEGLGGFDLYFVGIEKF